MRWDLCSIAVAAVLGIMGAVVTLFPPETQPTKLVWLLLFSAGVALSILFAVLERRSSDQESDKRHRSILAATMGGENFAYIEPIQPGIPNSIVKEQLAILRPRDNSPIYDLSWWLTKVSTGEVISKGQMQTLNGAEHRIVSNDLPVGEYSVFISARNGEIYETITVTEVDGGKHASFTVRRGPNPLSLPWATLLERSH